MSQLWTAGGTGILSEIRELKDKAKGQVFKRIAKVMGMGIVLETTLPDNLRDAADKLVGKSVQATATVSQGYKGGIELTLASIKPS